MLFCLFSLLYHLASCEFMLPLSFSVLLHWEVMLMRQKQRSSMKWLCKASLADQQKQVQGNIHPQIKSFFMCIDEILLLYTKRIGEAQELPPQPIDAPCQSGLGFNIGQPIDCPGKILFVKKKRNPFPMLHYVSLKLCGCNLRCSGSLNFSCDSSLK